MFEKRKAIPNNPLQFRITNLDFPNDQKYEEFKRGFVEGVLNHNRTASEFYRAAVLEHYERYITGKYKQFLDLIQLGLEVGVEEAIEAIEKRKDLEKEKKEIKKEKASVEKIVQTMIDKMKTLGIKLDNQQEETIKSSVREVNEGDFDLLDELT